MSHPNAQNDSRPVRGIWRAPYLHDGYPVMIATDSRGRKVAEVVMFRGLTPSRVRRMLVDLLNSSDPRAPTLRLVKPEPNAQR